MLFTLLLDAWAAGLDDAGRVFLGGVLVFHLLLVPARRGVSGLPGAVLESLGLAAASVPLAEIVRGMTGAARPTLVRVAVVVFLAHGVGLLAAAAGTRWPRATRIIYWPLVLGVGAALPLAAYAAVEFLGSAAWPLDGAVLGPVIRLLDAAP